LSKKQAATTDNASGKLEVRSIPIQLERVVLRHLHYRELDGRSREAAKGQKGEDVHVRLRGGASLHPDGLEVMLELKVEPDPDAQPYEMTAAVSGFFSRAEGMPDDSLLKFAGTVGLRLLFPYLREIVSNVSGRGIYGPLFLDPIFLAVEFPRADET
jgi:preprotein translocase subunit SecB